MKVLVTGSRDWTDRAAIKRALIEAKATIVVHGNARGADLLAKEVAIELKIEQRPYPARWDRYGRSAGVFRNIEMLQKEHLPDSPIDLVLAFPLAHSIGTRHMVKIAREAGIHTIEITP